MIQLTNEFHSLMSLITDELSNGPFSMGSSVAIMLYFTLLNSIGHQLLILSKFMR